jgi:hypothetical protein
MLGIMPVKNKGQYINQVCKAGWVVLKAMRRMIHLMLPIPPLVLKKATILELMDMVVVAEEVVVGLSDEAVVRFKPPSPSTKT